MLVALVMLVALYSALHLRCLENRKPIRPVQAVSPYERLVSQLRL
jgi:hypothetical protein